MKLSDFTLLREHDDGYEIGHPKGKSFKIPKEGLSKEQHAKIKGMAEGGTVSVDPDKAQQFKQGLNGTPPPSQPPKMYEGGDPAEAEQEQQDRPSDAEVQQFKQDHPDIPMFPDPTQSQGQAQAPAQGMPAPGLNQALQEQKIGSMAETAAQGQQAQQQAAISGQSAAAVKQTRDSMVNRIQASQAAQKNLYNAFASKDNRIDPDHYWNSKSTPSKIATGLGLILGGMGAGLTRGPNVAAEFINNAINRDIESQKADQSKKMNLWKMNREQLGSDLAADLQTQNQMLTSLKYKSDQVANNTTNDVAKARMLQQSGQWDQKIAQNNFMQSLISPSHETGGGAPVGSEQEYVNHMNNVGTASTYLPQVRQLHQDLQSKYMPGVGHSELPLTPQQKQQYGNLNLLQKTKDEAQNFSNTVGRTVGGSIPLPFDLGHLKAGTAAYEQAKGIASRLTLQMGALYGDKLSRSNKEFLEEIAANPGSLMQSHTRAKLQDIQNGIDNATQSLDETTRMHRWAKPPASNVAGEWAKRQLVQNPNDAAAKQVMALKTGPQGPQGPH